MNEIAEIANRLFGIWVNGIVFGLIVGLVVGIGVASLHYDRRAQRKGDGK